MKLPIKSVTHPATPVSLPSKIPAMPPVYRPVPLASVQRQKAPPVYRPNPVIPANGVAQRSPAPAVYRPVAIKSGTARPSLGPPIFSPRQHQLTVQRSCFDGIRSWFGSCFGSSQSGYRPQVDMEMGESEAQHPVFNWGSAQFMGYHKTAFWDTIKRTGDFKTGGGRFGEGIYLCQSDYAWLASAYPALNVLVEVGYVGDTSAWTVAELRFADYNAQIEGTCDVIRTPNQEGMLNQKIIKFNGPHNINRANIRVRLAR
jgi:hypothetical protein